MTRNCKHIIQQLFNEHYIVKTGVHTTGPKKGRFIYKLYVGNRSPVQYVSQKDFYLIKIFLKCDKNKAFTLNLSAVRQMDGRSWIKKEYKKQRSKSNA